jgi:hypothetical protein
MAIVRTFGLSNEGKLGKMPYADDSKFKGK